MAIDNQHGKVLIECDSCDEVFTGEHGEEFPVVWSAAKRDGWNTRLIAKTWLHGCPTCGAPT